MSSLHLLLLIMLGVAAMAVEVPLHDFEDVSVWRPNLDGGNPPQVSADTEHAREGTGMRLDYSDSTPNWGNISAPCSIPAGARALRFWVHKHSAAPGAAMHIWLFEADGDAWVQRVHLDGKDLAEAPVGWHEARLPVSGFRFDGRGQGTREMLTVDHMLIGCNFADLEVTVDKMAWEVGESQKPVALPVTADLEIEPGERGTVGVLDMGEGLPNDFATAHAPADLAVALRAEGFGVTVLKAGDLARAEVMTPDRLDAVILPFGPYFPQDAGETFLSYLQAGGGFLSTDGYAFDSPLALTEDGWAGTSGPELTAAEMDEPRTEPDLGRINTRTGKPGDQMVLEPHQIGVFDPSSSLEHTTSLRPAVWVDDPALTALEYTFDRPVSGFSSCGLTGVNSAVFPAVYRRWVPVLEGYSAEGTLQGTALSILHNYSGHYSGSSWAFSGLTDGTDLFLGAESRRKLLARVVADICEKVFLHELKTDFACYEPGETAGISVRVSNNGRRPASRRISLRVAGNEVLSRALDLPPRSTETVTVGVAVDVLEADYCPIEAVLSEGERRADVMRSALCIRSPEVLASGPVVAWKDNYLTVDGRPTFLMGTNQTGMMYFSDNENPAIWDRDLAHMAQNSVHILRTLHFSPYSKGGYEGRPTNQPLDLRERPERLVRQMDAIVQLAQKHRVAIFLTVHDWMGTVLTEEELAAQADWNAFWAGRYRDVPGIFYDVQNEPSVSVEDRPDVVALWNEFLTERYATDEALREAWSKQPPEAPLPDVPLGKGSNDWDDVRAADLKRFETELLNRWVKANVDGLRRGDPDAPICVGYLPSMPPADKILGVRHTDFSNMHYYGGVDGFASGVKLVDRRFVGKGFSVGEFGAQEAHDARVNGAFGEPVQASIHRFQTYVHYAAGMGAAFMANWDWKDFDECVFPWGLMRHCSNTPKPWLHTLAQGGLLLKLAEPVYESPEVFVVAPDRHRIGPRFNELNGAVLRAIDLLLEQRVNFGMVNEEDIGALPASAKVLYWPVPYCPTDETFDAILTWTRAGGTLYLSGDISFDATRRPTRGQRRVELGLPEAPAVPPFDVSREAWEQVPVETAVGAGKVLYAPYPMELRGRPQDGALYARVLEMAYIRPIAVEPAQAAVRALSIPTADGGRLYMLARREEGTGPLAVTLPAADATVSLAERGFAFVLLGPDGAVRAIESQGAVRIGGELLATADGHYALCAMDGEDVRQSESLMVLPHQCAQVSLSSRAFAVKEHLWVGRPGTQGVGSPLSPAGAEGLWRVMLPASGGHVALLWAGDGTDARDRLRDLTELRWPR